MDNLEIYWVFELAINPGRFEDLKTLMADMVEATQKNEVGALNYEWAISDDQPVCHLYERSNIRQKIPEKIQW
jgi:quinol monooxygenase YgiN